MKSKFSHDFNFLKKKKEKGVSRKSPLKSDEREREREGEEGSLRKIINSPELITHSILPMEREIDAFRK